MENAKIWVERADEEGRLFMSIREGDLVPDDGVYICCYQEGTEFFFAGDPIDFRSLNAAISENSRDEFEVVVTGKLVQTDPDMLEWLTEQHLADVTANVGKTLRLNWTDQDLQRMRRDSSPIHIIHAESLTLNL
ncbi:hypothetical protein KJ705_04355 [Patescibacteria group bacterium]|nr:hypothetical protein [Patescibacteria group bacterium]